jgi:lysozyme
MTMLTDAQQMLIDQEGLRLKVYLDSLGIETIGVGRNLRDKGITQEEAMILFNADLCDALDDVRHNCSCYDQLSRPRQLVMISLAFNMGRIGLGKFVRFLGALHLGHYDDAADELLNSKAAKQDAPARYQQLAEMMRNDVSEWV